MRDVPGCLAVRHQGTAAAARLVIPLLEILRMDAYTPDYPDRGESFGDNTMILHAGSASMHEFGNLKLFLPDL